MTPKEQENLKLYLIHRKKFKITIRTNFFMILKLKKDHHKSLGNLSS